MVAVADQDEKDREGGQAGDGSPEGPAKKKISAEDVRRQVFESTNVLKRQSPTERPTGPKIIRAAENLPRPTFKWPGDAAPGAETKRAAPRPSSAASRPSGKKEITFSKVQGFGSLPSLGDTEASVEPPSRPASAPRRQPAPPTRGPRPPQASPGGRPGPRPDPGLPPGIKRKPETLKKPKKKPPTEEDLKRWDPKRIRKFMLGAITLGELQGITKEEQRKIAEQGHVFLEAKQLDDAYTVFRGLLALDPRDPYYHLAIGAIAQERKELEEAEHWYSSAIHIRPRMGPAWVNRGEVRILSGRTKMGAEDLMKALELDPTDEHEWTVRARTILGALLARLDESKLGDAPSEPTDEPKS